MIFESLWRRAGAKGKVTAEKAKAALSPKFQDHFKTSKLFTNRNKFFRASTDFLSALKTTKVLFQQLSKQGILMARR